MEPLTERLSHLTTKPYIRRSPASDAPNVPWSEKYHPKHKLPRWYKKSFRTGRGVTSSLTFAQATSPKVTLWQERWQDFPVFDNPPVTPYLADVLILTQSTKKEEGGWRVSKYWQVFRTIKWGVGASWTCWSCERCYLQSQNWSQNLNQGDSLTGKVTRLPLFWKSACASKSGHALNQKPLHQYEERGPNIEEVIVESSWSPNEVWVPHMIVGLGGPVTINCCRT